MHGIFNPIWVILGIKARNRLQCARPLPKTTCTMPRETSFRSVEHIGSVLPQTFHVRTDRYLVQLDEIAVLLIVDLRSRPRDTRTPG